jgi:hypothetical protein
LTLGRVPLGACRLPAAERERRVWSGSGVTGWAPGTNGEHVTSAALTDVVRAGRQSRPEVTSRPETTSPACAERARPGLNPHRTYNVGLKQTEAGADSERGHRVERENDMETQTGGAPDSFAELKGRHPRHGRLSNLVPGSVGTFGEQPGKGSNLPSYSNSRAGRRLRDRSTVPVRRHRIPMAARSPHSPDPTIPVAERTAGVGGGRR